MPRKHRLPSYRLHKPSGQAVVRIEGRDYYLGKHGTAESRKEYDALICDLLARRRIGNAEPVASIADSLRPSVNHLILAFWQHAEHHYQKHGRATSELGNFRRVLRLMKRLYGTIDAASFSPRCLSACQQAMVEEGNARKTVNKHVNRIRHVFKWGVSQEMVPVETYMALRTVAGLQAGRTSAKETAPVLPVTREQVEAVLPFASRQVAAIVELLWYSGARPGEIVLMRMADLDLSESPWCYTPVEHKTEHHERQRRVWLGPECQRILMPWRRADPEAFLFQPAEAEAERTGSRPKRRRFRPHYTQCTLRHAVVSACEASWPAPEHLGRSELEDWNKAHRWTPNQLRHARATEVRKRYGLEASQTVLGHARMDVTQIYAEKNEALARRVALECG